MGMIDNSIKFAVAQAVTSTGDTASTNIYDIGSANTADLGLVDEGLWLNAYVDTTATSGGSATLQAVLQTSADNNTWTDAGMGPVVAVANLTAGAQLAQFRIPPGTNRYLRVAWRVGTAALTAGKFTAYVSLDVQRNISRPSGFSVA